MSLERALFSFVDNLALVKIYILISGLTENILGDFFLVVTRRKRGNRD